MNGEGVTPRELGLLAGRTWAKDASHDDMQEVAAEGLADRFEDLARCPNPGAGRPPRASEDEDAEDAFWEGFIDGVRAHVDEVVEAIGRSARAYFTSLGELMTKYGETGDPRLRRQLYEEAAKTKQRIAEGPFAPGSDPRQWLLDPPDDDEGDAA